MSGGGEGLSTGGREKRGHSKRKKKKRLGFRLDMTPLVDITFLLLTFFMFTTTMMKPQVMEMKIPPEVNEKIDVPESLLLTIYITKDNKILYAHANDEVKEIQLNKVFDLVKRMNLDGPKKNKLITTLKVDDKAKYQLVIKILDELNVAENAIINELTKEVDQSTGKTYVRQRKFVIVPITEADYDKLSVFDPTYVKTAKTETEKKK